MEGTRFDDLARRVGLAVTRRGALKMALVVAAGAGIDDASANGRSGLCRQLRKGCTRGSQCCSGACETSRQAPRGARNRCKCPDGQGGCNGACVSFNSVENCGACGNACGDSQICDDGVCTYYCEVPAHNAGTCGAQGIFCMIDDNYEILYATGWNLGLARCDEETPCPDGNICALYGRFRGVSGAASGMYEWKACLFSLAYCDPNAAPA